MDVDEEQAVRSAIEGFGEAWNNGDAQAAANCFTEDGLRVDPYGNEQHGRAEIEAAYDKMIKDMPGSSVRQERGSVRFLGPEYAILHGGIEIVLADGSSIEGHAMDVMKKVEGRWMILETHPKILAKAPGS